MSYLSKQRGWFSLVGAGVGVIDGRGVGSDDGSGVGVYVGNGVGAGVEGIGVGRPVGAQIPNKHVLSQ